MRRLPPSTVVGLLIGVLSIGTVVAVPAPSTAAPSAADDRFDAYAGGTYTVDPLANDEIVFSVPPSDDPLSLCGIRGVDERFLYVEQAGDSILVEVRDRFRGRTTITYDACQGSERDTATITLDVKRLADLQGVKARRGKVRFTNPNPVAVRVSYGGVSSGRPDATRTVPAGGAIIARTTRNRIYWVGFFDDDGVIIVVGDDVIAGLQRTGAR